jgi:hypothetical protein
MSFIAQFNNGTCVKCSGPLLEGQRIERAQPDIKRVYKHLVCPEVETPVDVPKDTQLCPRCFTYHRGECL